MRSLVSRLARLEQAEARAAGRRVTIQYGRMKYLPPDYTGERHVVTISRTPDPATGRDLFEWEERPGPESASNAEGRTDEHLIRVCYVPPTA